MATNSILNQVDTDKVIPQFIINNDGSIDGSLSEKESEKFKNDLMTYTTLMIHASAKEEEIAKKRKPLTQKLFGDIEKQFEQELISTNRKDSPTIEGIPNPLEGKSWFRFVKVLYIGL
jgi:glycosyltransferase involved in cell wall biosynthesis